MRGAGGKKDDCLHHVWDSITCLQQLFANMFGLMGSSNNVTLVLS